VAEQLGLTVFEEDLIRFAKCPTRDERMIKTTKVIIKLNDKQAGF
jgi:hypothetical protein